MPPRLKCPKCGCDRVQANVKAWWLYHNGDPQTQGDSYIEIDDDGFAICEDCGEQWRTQS